MNRAILDEGGTVMQFVGDAVMAVLRRTGRRTTTTPTARCVARTTRCTTRQRRAERALASAEQG